MIVYVLEMTVIERGEITENFLSVYDDYDKAVDNLNTYYNSDVGEIEDELQNYEVEKGYFPLPEWPQMDSTDLKYYEIIGKDYYKWAEISVMRVHTKEDD